MELNEFYHLLNFASNEIFLAKFVFGVWQLWVAVVTESSEGNDTPKTAAMIIERNFWFWFGLSVSWRFFCLNVFSFLAWYTEKSSVKVKNAFLRSVLFAVKFVRMLR